ncbi:uncharacterized protein [Neodiprion pinetum]|uniref:uncharacterized protein n=1 Tax=Neodiprion pinetum TaxID=441929 RepID=UPI003714A533
MQYYTFLIAFGLGARCALSFWPPAYKVDLNDRKVFVIASDDTDYDEESENEMIQAADLAQFESLADDEEKYKPLHSHVELYNKRAARTATEFAEAVPLFQPNFKDIHELVEEAKPFIAGFKRELDRYDFDDLEERVYEAVRTKRNVSKSAIGNEIHNSEAAEFFNKSSLSLSAFTKAAKDLWTTKKGKESETVTEEDNGESETLEVQTATSSSDSGNRTDAETYDYDLFKAEYYQELEHSKNDNRTFNYTDNRELEKTVGDVFKKIVDFKMPRNCTQEELTEFGAKALECLAYDYKHAKGKKKVTKILRRTWVVVKVWICVYLCVAVPCWCQKGWCCCCCHCGFCFPKERIIKAKRYYADNPPGVLVEHANSEIKESKTTEFEPTLFELEAYENFESAIRNL